MVLLPTGVWPLLLATACIPVRATACIPEGNRMPDASASCLRAHQGLFLPHISRCMRSRWDISQGGPCRSTQSSL